MASPSPVGQTVQINGSDLYYMRTGAGEPLLLLHGLTGSSADWAHLRGAWTTGYDLIIPDLRGHGRSTNPSGTFTHRQVAQDILALLDHLHLGHVKALGISGGANVLLHLATQHPDRLAAMVLVSAASNFPEQARVLMRQYTAEALTGQEWLALRQRHPQGEAQIRALYAYGRAMATSYDDMNLTPSSLATITARTLLVYGDRDLLYPVELAVEMYRAIPRCSLWIVPQGGHVPIFGERAEAFITTAARFLQEV